MADNVDIKDGHGTIVTASAEEVTTLNGNTVPAQEVQRIAIVAITSDGHGVDLGISGSPFLVDTELPAGASSWVLSTSLEQTNRLPTSQAPVQTNAAATTNSAVATSTTSADALASNAAATFRQFINTDASIGITLKLGSGTVTDYAGIYLAPGSAWDGLVSGRLYTGLVRCKAISGTPTLAVVES